jgi:cytochrome P450
MRVFVGGKSVGSIIDMQDEEQNLALKRAVGSAFMLRNVATYEEDVKNTLEALIHRIHEHPHFNLYETLQLFQLDFLIKIAFSENPGHLHSGTDVVGLARLGNKRVSHWFSWQAMPQLERFIFHNSIWSRWFALPSRWAQMGIQRLEARQHSLKAAQKHTDLLQYAIEASEKYPDVLKPQTVANLVNSIISAGADTTAGTMSTILYLLLKHSDKQQKVFEELENIICQSEVNWPQIPSYKNVNELPYLNAVIKESLRLNPPLAVPLERIVPENGTIIDGIFVPAGTVIGCMGLIVHYDQACYGADVQNFRPERWLEAPKEKLVLMERGFLAWGSGNRICLGRYVAEMEIKIVISTLLLNFQVSFSFAYRIYGMLKQE